MSQFSWAPGGGSASTCVKVLFLMFDFSLPGGIPRRVSNICLGTCSFLLFFLLQLYFAVVLCSCVSQLLLCNVSCHWCFANVVWQLLFCNFRFTCFFDVFCNGWFAVVGCKVQEVLTVAKSPRCPNSCKFEEAANLPLGSLAGIIS